MDNIPASSHASCQGFQLACPACRGSLVLTHEAARCTTCGHVYACMDGIWHFLLPSGEEHYANFLAQYQRIREDQGWGQTSPAYYRLLPWVEPTDPQQAIWSLRAQHYQTFIQKVLVPLERLRAEPLTILDLGAGNGWLSNRLAQRGHHVAAVDISLDQRDGLAACKHYENALLVVQADF